MKIRLIDKDMYYSGLIVFTVIFVTLGVFIDFMTENNYVAWLVILTEFFGIFLISVVSGILPRTTVLIAIVFSLILLYFSFNKIFFTENGFMYMQFSLFLFYTLLLVIYLIKYTLFNPAENVEKAKLVENNKTIHNNRLNRKQRKTSRRKESESRLKTAVKSGKYRGWWTGF